MTARDRRDGPGRGRATAGLPPDALRCLRELAGELRGRRPALFLDYDGTLAPIASRPELATLSTSMRKTLRRAAGRWPVTIVSGRAREDVTMRVGVAEAGYAGCHGFDIRGPVGTGLNLEVGGDFAPQIAGAAAELRRLTAGIDGVLVEDKRLAVAVHHRLVAEERVPDVEHALGAVLSRFPALRATAGKKLLEVRPGVDWDKGRAVRWLLAGLARDGRPVTPIYLGDDETDEHALHAVREHGIGVVVADAPRPTAARYSLAGVAEVETFLGRLVGGLATMV